MMTLVTHQLTQHAPRRLYLKLFTTETTRHCQACIVIRCDRMHSIFKLFKPLQKKPKLLYSYTKKTIQLRQVYARILCSVNVQEKKGKKPTRVNQFALSVSLNRMPFFACKPFKGFNFQFMLNRGSFKSLYNTHLSLILCSFGLWEEVVFKDQ